MNAKRPPAYGTKLLKWFCKEEYQEEILGDLEEVYRELMVSQSQKKANQKYFFHVMKFVRLSNFKIYKPMKGINYTLFKRGVKYSLKQYRSNFGHSFVNSFGLAIGIASLLSLMAFTYQQLSFDKHYKDSDRLYRLVTHRKADDSGVRSAASSVNLLPTMASSFVEFEKTVRMYPSPCFVVIDKQKKYRESSFVFADSTLFDVFDFDFTQGDPASALDGPFKVVLTESMVRKHFGNDPPMGRKLTYEDASGSANFIVSGVIRDLPESTHLKADFFASMKSLDQLMPWYKNWHYPQLYSYVKLTSEDTTALTASFEKLLRERTPEYWHSEIEAIKFQKVTDINLQSNYEGDWKANSSLIYVKIFIIVAIMILVISIVNYINLVVSRGVIRAREVGVRKVIGAEKKQLIFQFMTEALVNVFIAALFSVALTFLFAFLFRRTMGVTLSFEYLNIWPFNILVFITFILLVFLTGFYPALVMSNYKILDSFKQKMPTSGSTLLRKGLVFFQFAISGSMILMTLLMLSQSEFLQNKNLGFDEEHLIAIKMVDDYDSKNYDVLKNLFLGESFVESAAVSSTLPGEGDFHDFDVSSKDVPNMEPFSMKSLGVDEDYLKTYNLGLKSGRGFDKRIESDKKGAFLLNSAAAEKFGWEDPVGKNFKLTIYTKKREDREGKVIGLLEDFHFESLHKEIEPVVLYINLHEYYTDYLTLKLQPGNLSEQVSGLQNIYQGFNPNKPFEFSFIDDELDKHYANEVKQGNTMTLFATVAIILSCLGILGLITYATQKKVKEIGIRKIMGSSRVEIFALFVKDYLRLFVPSILVSGSLVYLFSKNWLSNFAYSIDFNFGYYLIGYTMLAVIILMTISYHTIKASSLNPVDSLRDE